MKTYEVQYGGVLYTIRVGRNKQDNWDLLLQSKDSDIWFHVDGLPSCHVILENDKSIRDIPLQILRRSAYLCKINSSAKKNDKCDVMYACMKNVSLGDQVGEVNVTDYNITRV